MVARECNHVSESPVTPAERIAWIYRTALQAVEPAGAVRREFETHDGDLTLRGLRVAEFDRVVVVAVGKAAHGMAAGACDVLKDEIDQGFILTKRGLGAGCCEGFTCYEAGHPIPDAHGVQATRAILDAARALGPDDLLIALISGGGSALLESPVLPLTLADIQETTRLLLHAGAPIDDLNAVRSVLSEVKGGGLRRAAGDAVVVSLILSDVLGNDPAVIASGPTIPSRPNPDEAARVLRRYHLLDKVPGAVLNAIESRCAADPHNAVPAERDIWRIVADNDTLIDAATHAARALDLRSRVVWRQMEGEASVLARDFVTACAAMPADVDVVLGGGEATVTVRGTGIGGRNTEFALAAAIELERTGADWHVASLASDGDDANTGAAGAIASTATITRARERGMDPSRALKDNNSAHVFAVSGGLVTPGLTGTNVNDLYIAVRSRPGVAIEARKGER